MSLTKVIVVVQARATSQRFPQKILRPLCGRPMLLRVIDRLVTCRLSDGLVVATSTDPSDDATAALAASANADVYRGPLDDVLARVSGAAEAAQADAIVRISGDSPLIDPGLVSTAIDLWRSAAPDLVTNIRERTFPKGQSVEVIATGALRRLRDIADSASREHVTTQFYRNAERFRIVDIRMSPGFGGVQMSVDTIDDFNRVSAVLTRLGEPYESHGLNALLDAYRALDEAAA